MTILWKRATRRPNYAIIVVAIITTAECYELGSFPPGRGEDNLNLRREHLKDFK